MDMKTPRHEKGSFAEAADHLISAFDCYKIEGDKRAAVKHALMAFESKEAPALFRFLQERDDKGWDEATASLDVLAELSALDGYDPNDEDEFGFTEDAPIGDDDIIASDDFLNDDDTAPVFSDLPVEASLLDELPPEETLEEGLEDDLGPDFDLDIDDDDDFDDLDGFDADLPEDGEVSFDDDIDLDDLPELDDEDEDFDLDDILGDDEPEEEDDLVGFLALPAPRG